MRKLALILCFTVMIAIIFSITAPREVTVQGENQIDIPAAEAEETQPDKEEIIRVMNGLLDTLKQDADDSYKLKDYATEQELTEAFEAYLTTELAEQFVDYYFRVEADGVYVFPTETMHGFKKKMNMI